MSPKNKFKVHTFYAISNKLTVEMEKRKHAQLKLDEKLHFLTNQQLNDEEIRLQAIQLVEAYQLVLETAFVNEFLIFKNF